MEKMKSMDQIMQHLFDSLTWGQRQEFTLNVVFKMQPLVLFYFLLKQTKMWALLMPSDNFMKRDCQA